MNDKTDDDPATQPAVATARNRVNFQGIAEARAAPPGLRRSGVDVAASYEEDENETGVLTGPYGPPARNWNALSRQVLQASRLCAIFIFFALAVGWPLGAYLSHLDAFGRAEGWFDTLLVTLDPGILAFAVFVPVLILMCGYILSNAYRILNAAQAIATAAQQFIQPDITATDRARSVGAAVRGQVEALNTGVDGALERLAGVEAMIRHHVVAIEKAGDAVRARAHGAAERVASERSRLIDLTEHLNKQADAFAAAIAERAQTSLSALNAADENAARAESRMAERLSQLEVAATKALDSFETLSAAIREANDGLRASTAAIEASGEKTRAVTSGVVDVSREAAAALAREAEAMSTSAGAAAERIAKAADTAIAAARDESRRVADESISAASAEAARVAEIAAKTLGDVKGAAQSAAAAASEEASKANAAAGDVAKAAQTASAAASAAAATLSEASKTAVANVDAAAAQLDERSRSLANAREALERENARLEGLILEQRRRAEKLAEVIAAQTDRLGRLGAAPPNKTDAPSGPAASAAPVRNGATPPSATAQSPALQHGQPQMTGPRLGGTESARAGERRNGSPPAPPVDDAARPGHPARDKEDVSWREILNATDDAAPIELAGEPAAQPSTRPAPGGDVDAGPPGFDPVAIISDLQAFTLDLEARLYGEPPPALRERYERGDRNVFANRILRLNETDVKRRVRTESAKDKSFEAELHRFLQGFERLLEDATTSETADEELEEYLSSPLGRVYLLIGATVGYFA